MFRAFCAILLCVGASGGCTRYINEPDVVGFGHGPFEMTTRMEWTLYEIRDRKAVEIVRTDMARSIDGAPGSTEEIAVVLLHRNYEGEKVRYRLEPFGARSWSPGQSDDVFEPIAGPVRVLIPSDVMEHVPYNTEYIQYVEGDDAAWARPEMSVATFAEYASHPNLVVTVRWYDVVKEESFIGFPPFIEHPDDVPVKP